MEPKDIAETIIKESIKELIKLFIPKKNKSSNSPKMNLLSKKIENYVNNRYLQQSTITSLVLGNRQILLEEIYIPLTIKKKHDNTNYCIDDYPQDLYKDQSCVLITDTAGMGKSTLMKKMFLSTIDKQLGIPFLIELRRLRKGENIFMYILKELNIKIDSLEAETLDYYLRNGGFIFFLDGYDEVSMDHRTDVSNYIQILLTEYFDSNRFFLTSRPETSLAEFSLFESYSIEHLKFDESIELIKKYGKIIDIADLLIIQLRLPEMKSVREYLQNPLLTSLLFRAFEYKNTIPFKKTQFYRQVYDANFEMHDLTKGGSFKRPKKSNLDSDNFHRVLRCLGFECLKRQSVEFESKDEILTVLEQCKEFCKDLSFSTADFLEDLLTTVPIFALDGHYYKWSHRSLQEYFAAQFIFKDSKDKQSEVLNNIYQHSEINYYLGTLELYADMDPTSFRKIIEYSFLKEFIKHYDKCCEVTIPGVKKEEFEKRIFLTFMSEFFIIQDSKKELTAESYKDADLDSSPDTTKKLWNLFEKVFGPEEGKDGWINWGINTWPRYGINTYVDQVHHMKIGIAAILIKSGRKYLKRENRYFEKPINISIPVKNQDIAYQITWDRNLCFNFPDVFEKTNKLLSQSDYSYEFNYELIKKEVDQIENEMNKPSGFFVF